MSVVLDCETPLRERKTRKEEEREGERVHIVKSLLNVRSLMMRAVRRSLQQNCSRNLNCAGDRKLTPSTMHPLLVTDVG